MARFSGSEPLIGEIVGLRTFRVDDYGLLLPLYNNQAWSGGTNTAECSPPTGDHRGAHAVPDAQCECGFYAYGTAAAAAQNRQSRFVLAVVSCWGGVVAGTQGVRAQHARIDAIWLHADAPPWVWKRIAARYPSVQVYRDVDAMLAEHPLSDLPCYDAAPPRRWASKALAALALVAVLLLGLVPYSTLSGTHGLWESWLVVTAATALLTLWLAFGSRGVGHVAAAVVTAGVLGWLLAPPLGLTGWLLRAPLLRALAVGAGGYLLTLRPHHFPVVSTPRERAFCGVRP